MPPPFLLGPSLVRKKGRREQAGRSIRAAWFRGRPGGGAPLAPLREAMTSSMDTIDARAFFGFRVRV